MPGIFVDSPVGSLYVHEEGGRIDRVSWSRNAGGEVTPLLKEAKRQLLAYFAGERTGFNLPLAPAGSPFQQAVYLMMQQIPYGETRTYGDLARELDSAAQPVGGACGSNPIPIIIPCHRVVAVNGLGGFSGGNGLITKRTLLRLEGALFELPL